MLRGNPGDTLLRRYVEALMALIQEATGTPVLATRHKDNLYEPQLVGIVGKTIRHIIGGLEPSVTETRLVNWVCEIRRERAGKPMRFRDYFPGYGARIDEDTGLPVLTGSVRLERLEINTPIFCP